MDGITLSENTNETASPLLSTKPLKIVVRKAKNYVVPLNTPHCYRMRSKPRGSVLIINNESFTDPGGVYKFRHGSTIDTNSLCDLFSQLGFNTIVRKNRKYHEMIQDVDNFANLESHVESDMGILVLLSHGENRNVISTDGYKLPYDDILTEFNNEKCPNLCGKPKLFIFPACRGTKEDYGVRRKICSGPSSGPTESDNFQVPNPMKRVPTYGDTLIAYGTVPGYVANRDTTNGTWYIQCLCKVFMKHACDMEIREMMDAICRKMGEYESQFGTIQTCSYEVRGCFNKLYFNPGFNSSSEYTFKYQ